MAAHPHPAHPRTMGPSRPGRTRTAPPRKPDHMPFQARYRTHTLFGLTGLLYLLLGLLALDLVWALGSGPEAWAGALDLLASPVLVAFHLLCLVAVSFVAVRFFRLFPKAQPPRLGPARPPPGPVIHAGLYALWAVVTLALAAILAGGIF